MRRLIFVLTGALLLILSACTKYEIPTPPCPDGDTTAKFSADIQTIFNNKCIVCHSGSQSPDLSDGWAYDELIDGEYVDPDFPCESVLYQVFSGSHGMKGATEEEVLQILGWIQDGAQDN
ncbi:MAG: hypothetical protein ABFS28_04570 [Bacteroidota bacterium]